MTAEAIESCASGRSRPDVEHRELVGVEGHGAFGARHAEAGEFLAGRLARVHEFALGPVTHDLEQRLAVDDHGRREVPVAAREVVVHEAAQVSIRWNASTIMSEPSASGSRSTIDAW
jgi:hypothetical protein